MHWLRTILLFLVMSAYASGLPVSLHQAEHARAAAGCCDCQPSWLLHYLQNSNPQTPDKQPAKAPCKMCAQLQAAIAVGDAPIFLVDAGTNPAVHLAQIPSQCSPPVLDHPACRGPPSIA